jgi:dihydropteroate synthase
MKGEMRIMNASGDERLVWDTDQVETVEAAKARFAEALLGGGLGIVTVGGEKKLSRQFDELAERIVVTPPMVGG